MEKQELTKAATKSMPASERFTSAVLKEFSANAGTIELTVFQKKLIQNYFIKLDQSLQLAETKRLKTLENNREELAYKWENLNMTALAQHVVGLSSVGLDPLQPNHVNLIPYKNGHTKKYDITPIIGYRGLGLKATKFGLEVPDTVIIEVIYETDHFKPIKKSFENKVEKYEFEITDWKNRGQIVGGFYYHIFNSNPEKNKLRFFTMHEIEKRKPKYASAEFWGGEKTAYVNGKASGKEKVEGWLDEMVYKTVYRAAYNDITIDSQKINEQFISVFGDTSKTEFDEPETTFTEDVKHEIVSETVTETIEFNLDQPKQVIEVKENSVKPIENSSQPEMNF
jgi:recombination protein RecT